MAIAAFCDFQKFGALRDRCTPVLNISFRSSQQVKHDIKNYEHAKKRVVQPYLFFNGRCEEALDFYHEAIGAEVNAFVRFKDSPDPNIFAPRAGEKIIHANWQIGNTTVFASDGTAEGDPNFRVFRSRSWRQMGLTSSEWSLRWPKVGRSCCR